MDLLHVVGERGDRSKNELVAPLTGICLRNLQKPGAMNGRVVIADDQALVLVHP
jgi:hypothetical protein